MLTVATAVLVVAVELVQALREPVELVAKEATVEVRLQLVVMVLAAAVVTALQVAMDRQILAAQVAQELTLIHLGQLQLQLEIADITLAAAAAAPTALAQMQLAAQAAAEKESKMETQLRQQRVLLILAAVVAAVALTTPAELVLAA
jgi:hypothetical protein